MLILGKSQSPEILLYSRAKLEHYSIIPSQLKQNISFSHNTWARKTSTFCHFECIPPSTITHFSTRPAWPCQQSRTIAPQAAGRQTLFLFTPLKSTPAKTVSHAHRYFLYLGCYWSWLLESIGLVTEMCHSTGKKALQMENHWCFFSSSIVWEASISFQLW